MDAPTLSLFLRPTFTVTSVWIIVETGDLYCPQRILLDGGEKHVQAALNNLNVVGWVWINLFQARWNPWNVSWWCWQFLGVVAHLYVTLLLCCGPRFESESRQGMTTQIDRFPRLCLVFQILWVCRVANNAATISQMADGRWQKRIVVMSDSHARQSAYMGSEARRVLSLESEAML